jgi:anti-sigma-K factor RskA/putative zinc finger protein
MTHEELRELIPLMALDSLPPGEEEELIAHLKVCRECSELLASHEQTAGALGLWAPPAAPPASLRQLILSQASHIQQFVPDRPPEKVRPRAYGRSGMRVAAAVAMAAALVVGGIGARQLIEQNDRLEQQRELLAEQRKALDLASAGSEIIPMSTTADFREVRGKVVVSDETDRAAVLLTGLNDPGDGVYTLWLMPPEGERRNVADFVPDDSGLAVVNLKAGVDEQDTLAVTLEPRRGNTRPMGQVVGSAYRSSEEGSRIS